MIVVYCSMFILHNKKLILIPFIYRLGFNFTLSLRFWVTSVPSQRLLSL